MSDKVRLATIQSNRVPSCKGLRTNPFSEDFSMEDLLRSIELRIAWYEELLDRAGREGCDLVVLTEDFTRLSLCMTFLDDRSIFRTAVERQTSLVPERLGAVAKGHSMLIVACYYALEGDRIYNVADLFGRGGELVGRYRKVHMPQYELWQVTPGDSFPAFETDIGWVGMLICYDQMWPEAAACCTMNGAQVICHPSAAVLPEYYMRARAKDNQVHYISSTWQNSMIASPKAEILADAGKEDLAIVWADVELKGATLADEFFYEYLYSGIRDHKERHLKFRRSEAYRVLTEPRPPLADQYPPGGVADTPEAIEEVYRKHKEIQQKLLRGEEVPYHWRW
ncbi:MAG TPA: carbon-nitrogen hydrolase family protein [Candidatus Latescibacteria bacterium]|nr:carbon-nitrogen hydrolase family protein [Candidatus Latescibacterota bacterium]